jgi:uncharacterized protein YegP (UPF0339 family)
MAISFELKSKADENFFFTGRDSKGELLLSSTYFSSKEEAERAIQDVRVGSMMSQNIAVGDSTAGEKYFAIKNQAGKILVKSVLFESELVFNNALHAVREGACIAEVNDLT